ncbi:hypothetical protein [Microvirga sp. VF16]|uniref:hypothetical protein n=1 Tax=Microvirga sp. VF16 TaxID=2807101 RepID=UPI00193E0C73|nr:hypothetical protein [Microvirga sp. VF16]QRM34148.1 hypothetical protein JO965_33345 [Microvirga sp. VF16]
MVDRQQEREHLILADQHLAAGKRRIAKQIILIQNMTQRGQDTTEAKKLLQNFEDTLEIWYVHRGLIRDAIGRG